MSDATPSSSASAVSGSAGNDERALDPSDVWPVYKGSSFNIWEPDTGIYYDSALAEAMIATLQKKRFSQRRTRSSAFAQQNDAVSGDPATLPCRRARIAFRDVARSTDTRTLVSALVPRDRVIVNQAPYLLRTEGTSCDEAYVIGVLCSMPYDWQARRTVELHMTFEQFGQLSIPDPGTGHPVRDRVVEIAGRLAAADERFAEWAAEVGVPVGSANDETVKQDLICELDACVAHLYGLDENDLAVIYETFSETVDYTYRHAAVLHNFRRLA
ncbi:MAG: hypothetical protein OXB92_03810 [Acidimicrobiaceae bacterium]|nr:hypothetical protein [Acidimicrobiia bacterium]MCY4492969.1 hypothetical protein [Acidimicrobiaceae bacterium]